MVQKKSKDSTVDPIKKSMRVSVKKTTRKSTGMRKSTSSTFSVPISDLSNSSAVDSYAAPITPIGLMPSEQKIITPKKGGVLQSSAESLPIPQPVPASQVLSPRTVTEVVRKLKVISFKPRVPKITQGRMRLVAYIGIAYVLAGVCTGSYALASIHKDDFLAGTVIQVASVFLGASTMDSLLTTSTSNTTSSDSGTSGGGATDTSGTSGSGVTTITTTSGSGSGDTSVTSTTVTSNTSSVTTSTTPLSTTTVSATLTPAVSFHFSQSLPFSGKVGLGISVSGADHVELAAVPQNALTPLYLGNANFISGSAGEWTYQWDTKNAPNGYYTLVAHIFNHYGSYDVRKDVAVRNVTVLSTTTQASSITTTTNGLDSTISSIVHDTVGRVASTSVSTTQPSTFSTPVADSSDVHTAVTPASETQTVVGLKPLEPRADSGTAQTQTETEADGTRKSNDEFQKEAVLNAFKLRFEAVLERYGVAVRAGDESAMKLVKDDISADRQQTLVTLKERGMLPGQSYEATSAELDSFIAQGLTSIESREKVIKERVGSSVTIDTDKDGIVDYDEVHLYKTNPLSADTDNDGFTDGAEIMSGFDPLSPNKQAVKTFQDPIKSGPLREDILSVVKIETEHATTTGRVEARFSGKALPNSFVTLYIFSTPVVVTVRTGDDGSWSYVFDKELEDGSHTVYAGITDNAGRIVAKSEPFSFVKKAEAYSGVVAGEPEAVVVPQSSELMSQNTFLLISALSVILLGLALVALGAYFMRPQEYELIPSNT